MPNLGEVRCSDCGHSFNPSDKGERQPCGRCGALRRTYSELIQSTMQMRTQLRWKHKRLGFKRAAAEGVSGSERSISSGRWVVKKRLIDRESDWYEESIVDEETGEVLHESAEPLSNHTSHGSAKPQSHLGDSPVTPIRYVHPYDQGADTHG